jgi:hypothetical protein
MSARYGRDMCGPIAFDDLVAKQRIPKHRQHHLWPSVDVGRLEGDVQWIIPMYHISSTTYATSAFGDLCQSRFMTMQDHPISTVTILKGAV